MELAEDTPVSMNMFGFTPDYFKYSEDYFATYLKDNIDNPKSEFYIPTMVNKLVAEGRAQLRVLRSSAQWFGVTYKEDKPVGCGRYPRHDRVRPVPRETLGGITSERRRTDTQRGN